MCVYINYEQKKKNKPKKCILNGCTHKIQSCANTLIYSEKPNLIRQHLKETQGACCCG